MLAGHDRETLQAELALRIRQALVTCASDPVQIANLAIRVREEMQRRERLALAVDLVSWPIAILLVRQIAASTVSQADRSLLRTGDES